MTSLTARARLHGDRSQRVFDAVLRALSEPGTVRRLPSELLHPDIPVSTWLALALGDVDVNVCVGGDNAGHAAHLVHDATGARLVDLDIAWIASFESIEPTQIDRIATGSALEPELGARVSVRVDSISLDSNSLDSNSLDSNSLDSNSGGLLLALSGPGIPGERHVRVGGLDRSVAIRLGRASGSFPAGFDAWLITDDGSMIAIPRSTQVVVGETDSQTEDF